MKRILAVIMLVALLGFGTMAFAHGSGYGGHMGYGGGYGMMGYGGNGGYMGGPGMMGYGGSADDKETAAFLEKTVDLRKTIHDKRFDFMEAFRAGDETKAAAIEKELNELTDKLYAEAPKTRNFNRGGNCW